MLVLGGLISLADRPALFFLDLYQFTTNEYQNANKLSWASTKLLSPQTYLVSVDQFLFKLKLHQIVIITCF